MVPEITAGSGMVCACSVELFGSMEEGSMMDQSRSRRLMIRESSSSTTTTLLMNWIVTELQEEEFDLIKIAAAVLAVLFATSIQL